MNGIRAWFTSRSLREQRLIAVMIALLAATSLWGGVIRPVRDGLASSRARYDDAVARLGATRGAVAAIKAIQRGRPRTPDAPLADAVRARADAAGFTLSALDPDGDRIRIAIGTAKAGALLGWIAGLEEDGVLVDSVTITANGDGTVAAQLTLKARRA